MAARIVQTVLQWVTDNASLAKLQSANRTVGDSVVQVGGRAITVNQQLAASYNTVARSAEKAAASAAKVGSGSALQSARGVAGAAGGVLATVGGSQAGAAVGSILALTSSLGPLGLVAGAATVGVGLLNAEAERLAQSSRDAANELKERAELVASGATTEEVQTQVDRLQTAKDFLDGNLADLNQYYEKLGQLEDEVFDGDNPDKARAAMAALFEEVSDVTGLSITEFSTLHQHIQDVTADSVEYGGKIDDLSGLMLSGALEANNATAAQEKLAEAQKESAKAAEKAAEIRSKALQNQNAQTIALITDEVNARQKLFEIEQEINQTIGERDAAILAAQQERDAQLADITEEGGQQRAEIVADSEARIAKIQRDSGQTIRNAIASRDALAAHLEKQRLATSVVDEKDSRTKALAAQTVAEAKSLQQQGKTYDKSIAAQVSAADKALAKQYEAQRAQEFAVTNSQFAQAELARNGRGLVVGEHYKMYNDLSLAAYVGGQNTVQSFKNGMTSALGGRFGAPQTVTGTYGAVYPSQAALDQHFDRRFNQLIQASSRTRGAF